ncbi:MAG: hypothetical protein GF344_18380 [Chitinivibrionales bacterium]|nr:hypothetical protein [Chitinivibrionales bacterium]
MQYNLENLLVDCLRHTLNIMLCTDSAAAGKPVERLIKPFTPFRLYIARTVERVAHLFRQIRNWNAMIVGPNCTFEETCITLASENPRWVPVISVADTSVSNILQGPQPSLKVSIRTKNDDIQPQSVQDPSANTIITSSLHDSHRLFSIIQKSAIQTRLLTSIPTGVAKEAIEVLFRDNPLNVEEWTSSMAIPPRTFQRELKNYSSLTPKKQVALYHAYRIAFDFLGDRERRRRGIIPAYIVDAEAKSRVIEYVLTRRSALLESSR